MSGRMTAQPAADELHLARSTVVLDLRFGRIPGGFQLVPGGRWLVDEEVYRAWRLLSVAQLSAGTASSRGRPVEGRAEPQD